MRPLAGAIMYAGALLGAIAAWIRAGGGLAGWEAAVKYIRDRFPAATTQTVLAVATKAAEAAKLGQNYQDGPGTYTPIKSQIPDIRRNERDNDVVRPDPTGHYPPPTFFHPGIVEIYDENDPEKPWFSIPFNIPSDRVLDRDILEQLANEMTQGGVSDFIDSPTVETRGKTFGTRVRFGGVYIGY